MNVVSAVLGVIVTLISYLCGIWGPYIFFKMSPDITATKKLWIKRAFIFFAILGLAAGIITIYTAIFHISSSTGGSNQEATDNDDTTNKNAREITDTTGRNKVSKHGVMVIATINGKFDIGFSNRVGKSVFEKFDGQDLVNDMTIEDSCLRAVENANMECLLQKEFAKPIKYLVLVLESETFSTDENSAIVLNAKYKVFIINYEIKKRTDFFYFPLETSEIDTEAVRMRLEPQFRDSLKKQQFNLL